jgi:hypothetical protein
MLAKMFRLLFYALLIYLAYQVLRLLLRGASSHAQSEEQVRGRPKQQSLDLSGMDVEDAKLKLFFTAANTRPAARSPPRLLPPYPPGLRPPSPN